MPSDSNPFRRTGRARAPPLKTDSAAVKPSPGKGSLFQIEVDGPKSSTAGPAEAVRDSDPAEAPPDPYPAEGPPDPGPAEAPPDPYPAEDPPDPEPAEAPPDPEPAEAPPDSIPT